MAYYQAHLLMLAGYSQFFVSGLVLPQPSYESDDEDDMSLDDEMALFAEEEQEEEEEGESEPIVVDEPCPKFAAADEDEDEDEDEQIFAAPITRASQAPEQRCRKRLSAVSESHVRTMSRWLRDSGIALGDRQRQLSGPDSPAHTQDTHDAKRLCTASRRPRLPALQTSFSFLPPRLSVA